MASNFGAPALLASFCRHAPPLRLTKAKRTADKKLVRCEGRQKIASRKQHTRRLSLERKSSRPHLHPAQGMEINVGVQMFPRQINLDLASPGHAAERTEEVLTFTECQPHAPSGKTEPGQWRLSGEEGERRALKSSGKRNPNNLVHATEGWGEALPDSLRGGETKAETAPEKRQP